MSPTDGDGNSRVSTTVGDNNAMLMPKKVKYRKQQRGRMKGKAWRGSSLAFGEYGLKAMGAAGSPPARSKRPVSP